MAEQFASKGQRFELPFFLRKNVDVASGGPCARSRPVGRCAEAA